MSQEDHLEMMNAIQILASMQAKKKQDPSEIGSDWQEVESESKKPAWKWNGTYDMEVEEVTDALTRVLLEISTMADKSGTTPQEALQVISLAMGISPETPVTETAKPPPREKVNFEDEAVTGATILNYGKHKGNNAKSKY